MYMVLHPTDLVQVSMLNLWIGVQLREVTASITNEFNIKVNGHGDVVYETGRNMMAWKQAIQVIVVIWVMVYHGQVFYQSQLWHCSLITRADYIYDLIMILVFTIMDLVWTNCWQV